MAMKVAIRGGRAVALRLRRHPSVRASRRSWRADSQPSPVPAEVCASFDGKYEAFVQNFNVFLSRKEISRHNPISFDGSEDNYYSLRTFAWSPDSRKLVAYHIRPGYDREVMQIESSPNDQIQPKHSTFNYPSRATP